MNLLRMLALLLAGLSVFGQSFPGLRPPAIPLVTHDPYFSVWSMTDLLTGSDTKHWTGAPQPMSGLVRIDGKLRRFLGSNWRWADGIAALPQVSREVTPTRTMFGFEGDGIQLDVVFLTPSLPDDLDLLSRPASYLTLRVKSTDGKTHAVAAYFDVASNMAVNTPAEPAEAVAMRLGDVDAIRMGSRRQDILSRSGDDLRIDWGYFFLAAPPQPGVRLVVTNPRDRLQWLPEGKLADSGDWTQTDRVVPHAAALFDFGPTGDTPLSRYAVLAYDDYYSVEYFGRKLRPWWRRGQANASSLILDAVRNFASIEERARSFDVDLTRRLTNAGGEKYAAIAVLAFRQTLAAHKLVADADGTPLYFSKENFSNGCIGTVDVTYPSAPFFLVLNPELLKGQLRFIFDYAEMPRWPWQYPPHDIGQYPLANGQVYGGGEKAELRQMPVEESGNMILLTAALAKAERKTDFLRRYWPLLTKWSAYLREKGLDPENQLSTDDFSGHLAHNTNLSLKAILAIGAYARMARDIGETSTAEEYGNVAKKMAADWMRMAQDGDHYRLTFDRAGTWSQKYNLVWDKLLDLHLFPDTVAQNEVDWYLRNQNRYGIPLDNRVRYTKLDWILWSATLTEDRVKFEALVAPVYRFLNESPSRVPMTDWYDTEEGTQRGFQARSVVGGVYIKLLADEWKRNR